MYSTKKPENWRQASGLTDLVRSSGCWHQLQQISVSVTEDIERTHPSCNQFSGSQLEKNGCLWNFHKITWQSVTFFVSFCGFSHTLLSHLCVRSPPRVVRDYKMCSYWECCGKNRRVFPLWSDVTHALSKKCCGVTCLVKFQWQESLKLVKIADMFCCVVRYQSCLTQTCRKLSQCLSNRLWRFLRYGSIP